MYAKKPEETGNYLREMRSKENEWCSRVSGSRMQFSSLKSNFIREFSAAVTTKRYKLYVFASIMVHTFLTVRIKRIIDILNYINTKITPSNWRLLLKQLMFTSRNLLWICCDRDSAESVECIQSLLGKQQNINRFLIHKQKNTYNILLYSKLWWVLLRISFGLLVMRDKDHFTCDSYYETLSAFKQPNYLAASHALSSSELLHSAYSMLFL